MSDRDGNAKHRTTKGAKAATAVKRGHPAPSGHSQAQSAAARDDVDITALDLAPAPLSPAMAAYFGKCDEKLGFVPNVLKAYAFDMAKLEAFVAMYNDLMLAPSGLSKLEREMIAADLSRKRRAALVDKAAAAYILQGALERIRVPA